MATIKVKKTDKTRGWYYFEDGTVEWFLGLNRHEKANAVRKHGKVVRFVPTD
jgi:hypothetical protein